MSRVGKKFIEVPSGVKINVAGQNVTVESAKGKLSMMVDPSVEIKLEGQQLTCHLKADSKDHAKHGLTRNLINNMIKGCSTGFKEELDVVGVGFKANVRGQELDLALGFSHPVVYKVPAGIKITVEKQTHLIIEGADKQMVGQVASEIRRYRKPEPYKGKGVKYTDEKIVRKAGKAGAGGSGGK